MTRNIRLLNPERYINVSGIGEKKLDNAVNQAIDKLAHRIDEYNYSTFGNTLNGYKYTVGENNHWVSGLHTGVYLLAYDLTRDKKFLEAAQMQMPSYKKRMDEKIDLGTHDVGFVFSPSCVAMYKLTGDKQARDIALKAAKHLYDVSYTEKGGFILRGGGSMPAEWACRTMMDTLLNIPLFYWMHSETGEQKYLDAANSQINITDKYLIRDDASSFHHYQFELDTLAPVRGLTLQGASDDSCWSRGHSWAVLGLPLAYSYTKDETLLHLHRDVTYYMLNHLPTGNIPYWDYCFDDGSDEPLDSSAAVIAVCGMLEALKYLDPSSEMASVYRGASALMLEAVIDKCTGKRDFEYDGLITHVTPHKKSGINIETCAGYGDYFYLEALIRCKNPQWQCHW